MLLQVEGREEFEPVLVGFIFLCFLYFSLLFFSFGLFFLTCFGFTNLLEKFRGRNFLRWGECKIPYFIKGVFVNILDSNENIFQT